MQSKISRLSALIVIASIAASLCQGAMADDHRKCKSVDADLGVVSNGNGTTSGSVRHGGRLEGTTRAVFTSALSPTPNPAAFSYTDEFSITTDRGVLKAHNVGLFVVGSGLFSEIAVVDSGTSTGDFAAATGALYITGKTRDGGVTFQAAISGEICLND